MGLVNCFSAASLDLLVKEVHDPVVGGSLIEPLIRLGGQREVHGVLAGTQGDDAHHQGSAETSRTDTTGGLSPSLMR